MSDGPAIAVLGTGIMGYPMADRLAGDGFHVRVWNRTRDKALPLRERGATVANTPAEAVSGADVVLTMLASATVLREVMSGPNGALRHMTGGSTWLQASTVGVADTEELRDTAGSAGVTYVDAPVLGTKQPAEQGKLVVLASGPAAAKQRCEPIFEPLASKVMWLGEAGNGTRLKLVANTWVLSLVGASAECVGLARNLGLDPQLFLDAIEGTGVDSAYAHIKGATMIRQEFPTSFPVHLAAKDASLVLATGAGDVALPMARAVHDQMERTRDLGYGDEDMAAVYRAVARPEAR